MTQLGKTWAIAWRAILALVLVAGALLWWMNRDTSWNAAQALAAPGSVGGPRVGIILVAIAQPARFEKNYWVNVTGKILDKVVPWPINRLAAADKGIVLFDPTRPYAPGKFVPTHLSDIDGRDADTDGTPWIERYRSGDLAFVEPSASMALDTGYFLYRERKQGLSTAAAKIAGKARYLYYGQLPDGYLPHGDQTRALAAGAIAQLRARHPKIVAGEFAEVFDAKGKRAAVRRILDTGVDTLVLGSGQPVYSDFEELRGSFSSIHAFVEEWRGEHGGKPVRIAVAPWMASEPGFDALWLAHFADTVPPATAAGQSALGIIALHGLPPNMVEKDSWTKRWPATATRLKPKMLAILKAKGYAAARVEVGSEAFADAVEDPRNVIVSVNELYRKARAERYTLAIALPIEFMAENTDTLFGHQAAFFAGLGDYRAYDAPPPATDWNRPYVRTLRDGATTIIYAGALSKAAQPRASLVLADAVGRVFPVVAR